jgi:hypothetical protein
MFLDNPSGDYVGDRKYVWNAIVEAGLEDEYMEKYGEDPDIDIVKELDDSGFKKEIDEKWSKKYKRSIDCNNPKGFSQRAHCQGRLKEDIRYGETLEMAYPTSFNIEEFKVLTSFDKRIKYVKEKLGNKLGLGSSRIVFPIDEFMVFKLAKNKKGIAQNKLEVDISKMNYDSVAKVFEYDDDYLWIEMERAKNINEKEFFEIVGIPFYIFEKYLEEDDNLSRGYRYEVYISDEYRNKLRNSEFVSDMLRVKQDYDMAVGDLTRLSSYGYVETDGEKRVILIDFGASLDIINTYYKRR